MTWKIPDLIFHNDQSSSCWWPQMNHFSLVYLFSSLWHRKMITPFLILSTIDCLLVGKLPVMSTTPDLFGLLSQSKMQAVIQRAETGPFNIVIMGTYSVLAPITRKYSQPSKYVFCDWSSIGISHAWLVSFPSERALGWSHIYYNTFCRIMNNRFHKLGPAKAHFSSTM